MDYPSFEDAVTRFRSFLDGEGHHGPMVWVFPNDVMLILGALVGKPRPPDQVVEEIANAYELAADRRLGVRFDVLGLDRNDVWCFIYCPADRIDAEHHLMPDGLKLRIPTQPRPCRRVTSEREWNRLRPKDMVQSKRSLFM